MRSLGNNSCENLLLRKTEKLYHLHKYHRIIILAIMSLVLVGTSCSTKKNTFTRRAYHNLTCHYNVYWNGMMSVQDGVDDLSITSKDDYNKILPVYNVGTKQEATGLYPKMDRAIKKASIGIQRHSMYFGGKEYNRWVKESYLMMGEAHFYKQDYTSARRVFDFVAKEYEKSPIHYEALLWLAKTYVKSERYEKAEATLNLLQSKQDDKAFPLQVAKELPLVYADFYIARGDYDLAYNYLQRGLEINTSRQLVTRINFILGQINQQEGDFEKASDYYARVIKRNPAYEMAFKSKLNMAQCYDYGSGESKYVNKVLAKMARETKNNDYLDQIYYALAQVAEKDGKDTLNIFYLRKSVSSSTNNKLQKSTSALELADKYFEKSNYMLAQAYYDTAVTSLPRDFPDYATIKAKTDVLSEIVVHMQVITMQDSLQYLASLDTTQLYAIIDGMIAEYVIEEERKEVEREDMEQGGIQFVDPNKKSNNPNLNTGKWYFYNAAAMGFGRSEFQKKWGTRQLEDNWRLSDKKSIMQSFETDLTDESELNMSDSTAVAAAAAAKSSGSPKSRSYYLADLPRTQEQKAISDSMIVEAYHALGFLYLEELRDSIAALDTYTAFQEKYPDNVYRLESWYALYKLFLVKQENEKAEFYKNLILSNYPESIYANVIRDPDYFVKLAQEKGEAASLYEKAYTAFDKEQYYRAITYAERGIELNPDDTALVPKFLYLRAMSQGVVDVPDSMYATLYYIAGKYPASSVNPIVRSVMKTLEDDYGLGYGTKTPVVSDSLAVAMANYKYTPEAIHMIMVVVTSQEVNLNALKIRISDFDKKYFQLMQLKVKSLMLDNERSLVTVGSFKNEAEVQNYLLALKNDEYVMSGVKSDDFRVYPISMNNYPVFYKDKSVEGYNAFWENNYPQR